MIQKYRTRSILFRFLLDLSFLVICVVIWHFVFLDYCAESKFTKDIFREAYYANLPPAYGIDKFDFFSYKWFSVMMLAYIAVIFLQKKIQTLYTQIVIVVFFTVLFALTETGRLGGNIAHFATYYEDYTKFSSPLCLLHDYTAMQSTLSVHGAHYPPGNLLLLILSGAGLTYQIVLAVIFILSLVLAYLFFEKKLQPIYCLLFIPAFLCYPTLDFVAIPIFFFMFILLLQKHEKKYTYFLIGILLYAWSFFSFISFVGAFFLMIFHCCDYKNILTIKNGIRALLLIVGFVLTYFCVRFFLGFDILICFKNSLQNNIALNSNPFDSIIRYLFRSSGNLLNFFVGGGVLMAFLFVKNENIAINKIRVTLLITLFLLAFSGLFFMETDRVWYFFYPLVALIAADHLSLFSVRNRNGMLLLSAIYAILFELGLRLYA